MTEHSQDTLDRMESMLRRCRRRIRMAEISVRLREGLHVYLSCLLAISGIFLVLRALAYALKVAPFIDWTHLLAVAGILALLIFGRALLRSFQGRSDHVAGAAERLDLAQANHNRIASAIALLRSGEDSTFAEAAIRDGFEHLEQLQAEEPHVDRAQVTWRRKGGYLLLSLAMVLAGLFLVGAPRPADPDDPTTPLPPVAALADPQPGLATPDAVGKPKRRGTSPGSRQPRGETPPREDEPDDGDKGKRPEPNTESLSEGPAGQHASGNSRSSQSSSNSSSAASGAGVKSKPGESEAGKPKKPRTPKKQTAGQPKVDQKNEKGGSINARGSSGSGSMRTAQNEWSSKVKAKSSDTEDFEQEEEPDEEMDPDKQRMGVQPALKNRTSRVSRELSLSMGNDLSKDMMKGRGGPSAQKKSRGTASMIMGVPVPGFVRGRLLPGPTKSTQEEVEPPVREGDYAAASELQSTRPEEDSQEHFQPSPALGIRARDYLIQYHAENENKRNGAPSNE